MVSPRGVRYTAPLVVLVGRWTGSMGEGLAVGFDALSRATVAGTEMAQLNGAIYSYTLPHSAIRFVIPAERLFHVNGQPREDFRPSAYVDLKTQAGKLEASDPALDMALKLLQHKK